MKTKGTLVNNNEVWSAVKRYKVNQLVSHNGSDWQNITGKNSEPGVGVDWVDLGNNVIEPYLVYNAKLTQTGTSAPTAVIERNTLGEVVTWSYSGIGSYNFIIASAPGVGKIDIFISNGGNDISYDAILINSASNASGGSVKTFGFYTSGSAFATKDNDILLNTTIEIRVYL